MSQSLSQLWLHLIFSTKDRERFLADQGIRTKVYAYMSGIFHELECNADIIGGVADHVHVLCRLSKNEALKDVMKHVKQSSSIWIKEQWPHLGNFYWQKGYGAFSVSPTHLNQVRAYIENQEAHHAKIGFQDEFRSFLERYQVAYDERFVWG